MLKSYFKIILGFVIFPSSWQILVFQRWIIQYFYAELNRNLRDKTIEDYLVFTPNYNKLRNYQWISLDTEGLKCPKLKPNKLQIVFRSFWVPTRDLNDRQTSYFIYSSMSPFPWELTGTWSGIKKYNLIHCLLGQWRLYNFSTLKEKMSKI